MRSSIGSAKEQFENEAFEIKKIIHAMIDSGNTDMARQLLEQYSLLNPTDSEINGIREMLRSKSADIIPEKVDLPDEYGILNNIETVFVLTGIIFKRVGSIDSALRKIKLMEDKWGYKPLILTCAHNIENRQAQVWLATAGDDQVTINTGTRMFNVYEYFQKSYAEGLDNIAVYSRADDGTRYVEIADNFFEVFDGDALVRKEYYHGNAGSLRMVSFYDNGKRMKDMIYDDWGYLNKTREFDPESGALKGEKFYTTGGELCIESFHEKRDTEDEDTLEKLIVYDSQGSIEGEYTDNAELVALCLKQIMSNEKFYLFIVEDDNMAKAVTMLGDKKRNMALCEIVHNIFLNDAYDLSSRPQRFYTYLCENHEKYDGIIMLTEDSRRDFQKLYEHCCSIFVIPHPYPYEIKKTVFNERDHKKAVIVSRLNITKLINMSIDIFSLVVKEVPDARLEIYGRGDEEDKLREQIIGLGLEKNVFLMGYTDDPLATFKTAALSMMTSLAEGYGMTLMESICNGCPAFAFDVKYGPSEIIKDGQTGFLIERFNVELFARKMVGYFKDEKMQHDMSNNCYEDVSRFSTDRFLENWFNMTKKLYEKHLGHRSGRNT